MSSSDHMIRRWANPIQRAALMEARNMSQLYRERGAKISVRAKERWANPEFKERMSETMKQVYKGRIGSPHSTAVTIDGIQYPSIAEAVRMTGKSRYSIMKGLKA